MSGYAEPTLLLLHGGGAHSGWWDPVLPFIVDDRRLVAFDFSGHGDSGQRPGGYLTTLWADEIEAVIRTVAGGRAVIVGHSLGGRVGTIAAGRHPSAVEALVTVDTVVPPNDDEPIPRRRAARVYHSHAAALDAFRVMPPQPEPADKAMLASLAERSVTATSDEAWGWKFDRRVFDSLRDDRTDEYIDRVSCPLVVIQGALSDVARPGLVGALSKRLGRPVPLVVIPGAHHHVTLDAPEALAALLAWLPETRLRDA